MLSTLRKSLWLFGFAVLLLILFLPGYTKLQESRAKNRRLEEKFHQMAIENSLLQEELKRVQNDPFYQEKIARDKMGVVRKGEIPIKIFSGKKQENRLW
ncbi:MAG: septum formation initiator family protein [Candidatus Omnitrophica bacterium]|nr:septum formation initiator family protein [Candidatus Omnitrophota bacterium]MBU4302777.1 septum formation initiator family protein [Candidatus Omnitrophota bacterium]MBU4467535.1 septum formation initiator family protein [Candidatus Omnitrophota bacterium]MCG2707415.1 septum formation initiator family protein [Candidatus Omnitrophota bacterium]